MMSMQKEGQHEWRYKTYHIYHVSTHNTVLAVTPDDHFKVMERHDLLSSWSSGSDRLSERMTRIL